jgi:hypothetical protein
MKKLNRASPGFLGTIILGVIVAWSAALPRQTDGEQFRGNCKTCITETFITCGPRIPDGRICGKQALQCVLIAGEGLCYRGSPSPCFFDSNCQALWHEACVGS